MSRRSDQLVVQADMIGETLSHQSEELSETVAKATTQTYEVARLIEAESKNLQSVTETILSRAKEAGGEVAVEARALHSVGDAALKKMQLTTEEFFQEIKAHLSPDGVLTLNTAHVGSDYRLVQAFVNTLYQVFPSVYLFDVPGDTGSTFANTEIVATMRPSSLTAFRDTLRQVPEDSLLGSVAAEVLPTGRNAISWKSRERLRWAA